jgi:hypothetical protein
MCAYAVLCVCGCASRGLGVQSGIQQTMVTFPAVAVKIEETFRQSVVMIKKIVSMNNRQEKQSDGATVGSEKQRFSVTASSGASQASSSKSTSSAGLPKPEGAAVKPFSSGAVLTAVPFPVDPCPRRTS